MSTGTVITNNAEEIRAATASVCAHLLPVNDRIDNAVATLAAIYSGFSNVSAERCIVTPLQPRLNAAIQCVHYRAASRSADALSFNHAQREIQQMLAVALDDLTAKHRELARELAKQIRKGAVDHLVEYDELHYRVCRHPSPAAGGAFIDEAPRCISASTLAPCAR